MKSKDAIDRCLGQRCQKCRSAEFSQLSDSQIGGLQVAALVYLCHTTRCGDIIMFKNDDNPVFKKEVTFPDAPKSTYFSHNKNKLSRTLFIMFNL